MTGYSQFALTRLARDTSLHHLYKSTSQSQNNDNTMATLDYQQDDITIQATADSHLAATVYSPLESLPTIKPVTDAVLIAPATGIRRQFYGHFAGFLASQGYGVLSFDFDGVGDSLQGDINDNKASLQSWGEQDLPAALDKLMSQFPNCRYHLIGNSAGGQLIGLMPNAQQLTSVFNVGASSGQLRNFPTWFYLQAQVFMNLAIPLTNALFGHSKCHWFGMGQPLPKNVGAQWRQWCNGTGYVATAFGKTIHRHYYDELTLPMLWLHATDDDIAVEANVDDMISVFSKAQSIKLKVAPQDYELAHVGHTSFFRRQSQVMWPLATDWLQQHA